ncbi:hypothetical protein BaRGS_00024651 [Batillaria attramentaria]|uniref:Uncharacterized protein n=1 Tax=Batillaria attramentaria TaxID=370345 RepID=A0ABD0KAR7_9CAEN
MNLYVGGHRPIDRWNSPWPDGISDFQWMTGERINSSIHRELWQNDEPNNSNEQQNVLRVAKLAAYNKQVKLIDSKDTTLKRAICELLPPPLL